MTFYIILASASGLMIGFYVSKALSKKEEKTIKNKVEQILISAKNEQQIIKDSSKESAKKYLVDVEREFSEILKSLEGRKELLKKREENLEKKERFLENIEGFIKNQTMKFYLSKKRLTKL
jgi:hypothetical protein